jgi:hypothetical protein
MFIPQTPLSVFKQFFTQNAWLCTFSPSTSSAYYHIFFVNFKLLRNPFSSILVLTHFYASNWNWEATKGIVNREMQYFSLDW